MVSLLIGLFVATIGLNNPAGVPRFTFGNVEHARRHRFHCGDDRAVRRLGGLRDDRGRRARAGTCVQEHDRQRIHGAGAACSAPIGAASFAATSSASPSAPCPAPARTSPPGSPTRSAASFSKTPEKFGKGQPRGHHRGHVGQQCLAVERLGPGAGLRHPRRHHHRHRHRRALREGAESRADALHLQSAEDLRGVPDLHPGQPVHDPARLGGHQACAASAEDAAQRAHAA